MLVKVRAFAAANREFFPEASVAGKAFAAVDEAATAIETLLTQKGIVVAEARKVKKATRNAIVSGMKAIAQTAKAFGASGAGINKFQMPAKNSAVVLLGAARAFVRDADEAKEKFVQLGMAPTFVSDLKTQVNRMAEAMDGQVAGRSDEVLAQAGIKAAIDKGLGALRTLDVVVANTLEHDPARLAAWRGARKVEGGRKVTARSLKPMTTAPVLSAPVAPAPVIAAPPAKDESATSPAPDAALEKAS
jgi:hypothetical protein